MAQVNYNQTTDEYQDTFTCIPAGEYQAIMESSEYDENKKKTGMLFSAGFQIIEGKYKGRKLFDNFHLEHENSQAKQIGERRFNSIKRATGVAQVQDSTQLHNIPILIIVGVQRDEMYGDENGNKNNIKGYKPLNENGNPVPQHSGAQTVAQSQTSAKHPWEKQ